MKLNDQDRNNLIIFLRDLVRISSPSSQEEAVAARIAEEMRRVGFDEVWVDEVGNVVGRIGSETPRREDSTLLMESHIDTVGIGDPASWDYDPFEGKLEDGYIYGRGASDDKQGLAAMVYGAKLLLDAGVKLNGTLYVAGIVQEEDCDGYAAGLLCEALRPDAVIIGEATDLNIYRGHRGRMELKITVYGRSCHASAPERGLNAVYEMGKVLDGIQALAPRLKGDPFLGKGTIAVTRIESTSGSLNVVPDSCTAYIDRRLTVGETEASSVTELEQVLREADVRGEVSVLQYDALSHTGYHCVQKKYYPTWLLPEDHPLVQAGVRAVEAVRGQKPQISRWVFSTDGVATMGRLGIPTIGFAAGNEIDAHTTEDRVKVDDLVTAAEVYARMAVAYLGAV
ncbi:MAG: YgeY family selenium metabolism-linked hydrolase [Anaerolineae bacterium]|nr:YgeY family selenium metabolism-linked hydrolase [Anaerolineae bacterium]